MTTKRWRSRQSLCRRAGCEPGTRGHARAGPPMAKSGVAARGPTSQKGGGRRTDRVGPRRPQGRGGGVLRPRVPARHAGRHPRDGDRDRRSGMTHRVHIRRRPPRLPSGPGQRQERVDVRGLPAVRAGVSRGLRGLPEVRDARGLGGYPAERARPEGRRRDQNRSADPEMDRQAPPGAATRPGERVNYRWVPCSTCYRATGPGKRGAVAAKRNAARAVDYGGYPQCGTRGLGGYPQSA